ncbi:MAG: bifunctional adenosylcobinamide kinase/adenosylcobinamide-phosphate guanylyltransferase [Deltaproteobacteria bacterium]|nr:bifunctional adenosylcobinamide kinase/adenosylcobinamide-phosphate guanylyltransferase [Deltaproteobacteria bacterium]
MAALTLVLGGAKSGKTGAALVLGQEHPAPRCYLATAEAHDEEMKERIRRHQVERGGDWRTWEEPLDPAGALKHLAPGEVSVVLLDCLTLWISNLMAGQNLTVDEVANRVEELAAAALAAPCPVIIVSNEVGWGIVPENKLARDFRDAAGRSHQILAGSASTVWLVVAGLPLKLKG